MCSRSIVNKYHEGKVKRTLKRELKVSEIAEREANGTSTRDEIVGCRSCYMSELRKHFSTRRNCECAVFLAMRVSIVPTLRTTSRACMFTCA